MSQRKITIFQNPRISIHHIFLVALIIRLIVIQLDPFLYHWDEHYHALVAKNLSENWLVPILRTDPVIPYDFTSWCCNHIWLHKPPLFLYQMAISIKLLGVNEFAVRLPSALMGALLVYPVFSIGKIVFSRMTGLLAAGLIASYYFQLEQTSGAIGMDHNDVCFTFYITLSIWALTKFYYIAHPPT